MSSEIRITAIVSDAERPVLQLVAEQLRACLAAATGSEWPVTMRFRESLSAIDAHDPPTAVVASLLPDLDRTDEPIAVTQSRWRDSILALPASARSAVLFCTIFRHVGAAPPNEADDHRSALRERIRRLNLMAIGLSHETGAAVIDIDRAFAQQGARQLRATCRLDSPEAARAAAHGIVTGLLRMLPDEVVAPEIVERARAAHGELRVAAEPN